jgi:hypothetical protein
MDSALVKSNQRLLERLEQLAATVSDEGLLHPMDAGWTVASVLAHLAFWDHRACILIEKWKKEGIGESPLDTDLVNEVTRYFFLALPPREALRLALESARAIDQTLVSLDPAFLEAIATRGLAVQIDRGRHRGAHLDEIERALGKK